MARPPGARNADYAQQRAALSLRLLPSLLQPAGSRISLRELALAAGTSVSNLRHYFGDRQGVVAAVFEALLVLGAPHLARSSQALEGDVRASLAEMFALIKEGWERFGVGTLQAAALALGLDSPDLGPAYLNQVLEPLLQTAEARLRRHVELGDLAPLEVRVAALQLMAPVVLALLHQHQLSGHACRPLDLDALVAAQIETFLALHPQQRQRRPGAVGREEVRAPADPAAGAPTREKRAEPAGPKASLERSGKLRAEKPRRRPTKPRH